MGKRRAPRSELPNNKNKKVNTTSDMNGGDMENVRQNINGMNRGPIAKLWHNVQGLWRMVRDPDAPKAAKLMALGALVYLVSPLDLAPDILPFGLLDDAAVITAVVAKLASDLKRYLS